MQQPAASIDPDDPIACSQWALSLGTNVAELKAAVRQFGAAVPALFACRGLQELNVALGGTLQKESADLPQDRRHGTPDADSEDARYRKRHTLKLRNGGMLESLCATDRPLVNSLHSFLIDDLAPGLTVEAVAEDGSVEAVSVARARAFALGTMFHPEYWASSDHASARILTAFADAVRTHHDASGAPQGGY